MLKVIRTDLRKSLFSIYFLLSMLVLICIVLSTTCVIMDSGTPEYTTLEFVFKTNRKLWMTTTAYSAESIFENGFTNQWIGIMIPLLAAFSCVPIFCDEYNSNCWRHYVSRIGVKKYTISKIISTAIVSALLVFICYAIFASICFGVFPDVTEYSNRRTQGFSIYPLMKFFHTNSNLMFVLCKIFSASCVAVTGGLFCLFISSLTMNKYTSLGIPVLLYFLFEQIAKSATNTGKMSDLKYEFLDNSFRFSQADYKFKDYTGISAKYMYLYYLGTWILFSVIYCLVMKRRIKQ